MRWGPAKRKLWYSWFQVNFILNYWYITIALLHDIIFINTHENEFYTFYLYIFVIMNLLRKVLKRKKRGKNTRFNYKTWSQMSFNASILKFYCIMLNFYCVILFNYMIEFQYEYINRHLWSSFIIKSGVSTPFFSFSGLSWVTS